MEITFLSDRTLTFPTQIQRGRSREDCSLLIGWKMMQKPPELSKAKFTPTVKGRRVSTWRSSRTLRPSLLSRFQ